MISDDVIQQAAKSLLAACPAGSKVILFGSHARGDARPGSDLDFLVIEPTVKSRLSEAARLARVIRSLRVPADIIVVSRPTYEQWKDAPNSVFNEAAREGKVFA
jgi:predicted nucleotidyltransferase